MRGANIVWTLLFIVNFHLLSAQNEVPASDIEDHVGQRDHYSFVAIIEILFRDGMKKQCTGAIIHDYVALTAAHCFVRPDTFPELTLSFVIIGTSKMYDTGYEQYLPMERYKVHPRFRGWTADLALVYTYMSMISGKPGKKIMLAGEKIKNPIDTSVTVLSWANAIKKVDKKKPSQEEMECKPIQGRPGTRTCSAQRESSNNERNTTVGLEEEFVEGIPAFVSGRAQQTDQLAAVEGAIPPRLVKLQGHPVPGSKVHKMHRQDGQYRPRSENSPDLSYLNDRLEDIQSRLKSNSTTEKYLLSLLRKSINKGARRLGVEEPADNVTLAVLANASTTEKILSTPLQGARRKIEHLRLTVEMFGFVNLQICKQLVEKALPPVYGISEGGDVICYSSEDNYISDEDSGAPVVRHGFLLGITVGGVEVGSEHVAVAMRISCFCSWIIANLPYGGNLQTCCKNCCSLLATSVTPESGKKIEAFKNA